MDSTVSSGAGSADAVALGLLERPAGAETPGALLPEDDSGLEAADVSILPGCRGVAFVALRGAEGAEAGAREAADFPAGLPGRLCLDAAI